MNEMMKPEDFQGLMVERLRADVGKLIPDEKLAELVEQVIQKMFFTRKETTSEYGSRISEEPSWFEVEVEKLLQERARVFYLKMGAGDLAAITAKSRVMRVRGKPDPGAIQRDALSDFVKARAHHLDSFVSEHPEAAERQRQQDERNRLLRRDMDEMLDGGPALTDHQHNAFNREITVRPVYLRGAGGAYLAYQVFIPGGPGSVLLRFHEGFNKPNGLTNEVLLAVLIDRMRGFQSGPYNCRENALALTKLQEALFWLAERAREREQRGVEGTPEK